MNCKSLKLRAVISALLAAGLSQAVSAQEQQQELELGVRVGASYTDNVYRTATSEVSSGAAVLGVDLSGERSSGRFRYNVLGDIAHYDYFETGVHSEQYGRIAAESAYHFVPDTFQWNLGGSFDQVRADVLRPAAPENLENVTTVATGPQLRLRFGDVTESMLRGRYVNASYSDRDFDSETLGGTLTIGRRMSPRSFLGLGASFDDVSYSSDSQVDATDFERKEAFVRFSVEGVRTTFEADVGYAEISSADADDSGPMARLSATRRLSPHLSGFASYTREYPTSEEAAFTPQSGAVGGVTTDASVLTGAARETEATEIGLRLDHTRTSAELAYAYRNESTVFGASLDRDYDQWRIALNRRISPRSTAGLFGAYVEEQFGGVDSEFDELMFGAQLSLAIGRRLRLDFQVEQRERDGQTAADGYDELSGGIFLRYGTGRQAGVRPEGT